MGKSSPSPPSPQQSAQAQAQANRINQITPFGNLTFSGPDRNTATTTLSPVLRATLSQEQAAQYEAAKRANQLGNVVLGQSGAPNIQGAIGFGAPEGNRNLLAALRNFRGDLSGLPGVTGTGEIGSAIDTFRQSVGRLGSPEFNGAAPANQALAQALGQFNSEVGALGDLPQFSTTAFDRNRIEDALFDRGRRLLQPQQEAQREALQSQLANQGLPQGQEAYRDEFNRLGQQQDLAFADLADRAILLGGQESDRVFGQDLGAFQAQLQGRGQGFQEALGGLGARSGVIGQQFGQGLQEFGADLARRQNLFGEINQEFANRLGAQGQQFGQEFGLRQQGLQEALSLLGAEQGIQQQRFGEAAQRFGIASQQRQQNIERELLQRQVPLNELQALLGLAQTQQPSFFAPGNVDVLGAQALQQQAYQNQAANRGGLFGSLIGAGGLLGGALLGNPGLF